jgi:hypothetical protein
MPISRQRDTRETERIYPYCRYALTGAVAYISLAPAQADGAATPVVSAFTLLPRTAHGVSLRVQRRPDTIAFAMRIQNWAQIVPYRISFLRHSERPVVRARNRFRAARAGYRFQAINSIKRPDRVSIRVLLIDCYQC